MSSATRITSGVCNNGCYISPIGIDTIRLRLYDFEIADHSRFQVRIVYDGQSGQLRGRLPWAFPWGGALVTRAVQNSNRVRLTIEHDPWRGRVAVVECSLPRVRSGSHNFHTLTKAETKRALHSVNAALAFMGLSADLWTANLSRIDICRNVETAGPLPLYWPVFETRDGKRIRNKKDYGGTGFLWKNLCRELAVYDKIAQLSAGGHSVEGLPCNVARFEYRLMSAKSVRRALGAASLSRLWKDYGAIGECFREAFADSLFRADLPGPFSRTGLAGDPERAYFQAVYGSRWVSRHETARGREAIIAERGGIEEAARFQAGSGPKNRMRLSRYRRNMQRAVSELRDARRFCSGQPLLVDLERELKAKVLAA